MLDFVIEYTRYSWFFLIFAPTFELNVRNLNHAKSCFNMATTVLIIEIWSLLVFLLSITPHSSSTHLRTRRREL